MKTEQKNTEATTKQEQQPPQYQQQQPPPPHHYPSSRCQLHYPPLLLRQINKPTFYVRHAITQGALRIVLFLVLGALCEDVVGCLMFVN